MERKIFIADDDREIREKIGALLEREGFNVISFETGDALLEECSQSLPDMVLLDIVMPGTDGLSCCSILRKEHEELPIMIISAKDSPYDRITALSLGCDDYMVKPFHPLELTMRIKAILRRCGREEDKQEETRLEYGPLTLIPGQKMCLNNGQSISLAPGEFNFLSYLIRRPGHSASRGELLRDLWHLEEETGTRVVDYLVKRLRKKLDENDTKVMIETVWGYGFRLNLKAG
jgi:DNA-binding response OmpR family regulator